MRRRFVVASAIAAVLTAVFLPGSGLGSPGAATHGAQKIPAGLAAAIHARFGVRATQSADSPTEHPFMGASVAMSADGTTALVAADGAGNLKGAVYIYHVADKGSWVSSATPAATLSGKAYKGLGGLFGWSVAISADGTTAFVSAPFSFQGDNLGAVFVFHVPDESAWASTSAPTATLTINNGGAEGFGIGALAASSDGTTLVVGDPEASLAGAAYVFHVASESAWASTSTPTATLTNAAQPKSDNSAGDVVAISGDGTTALVSDAIRSKGTGGAYLFHVASEAAWTSSSKPTAILTNGSGVAHDYLGAALAFSGDGTTAFLGAPGVDGYSGAVDVFHVAAEPLWVSSSTPGAILTNGGVSTKALLGFSLAVSSDGATVAAGAPNVNRSTGATDLFHASDEAAWTSSATPTAALTDSTGAHGDELGSSVASTADGATVLVGAPGVNWRTGKADVFHVADAGSWASSSTPAAVLTNSALPKPLCVVPNVRKYHLHFARELLGDANCRLGKVKTVHSTKKNRKTIVSQSPAPGRRLPPGSRVNVKIGK